MRITIDQVIQSSHSNVLVPAKDTGTFLTALEWDSRQVAPGSLFVAIIGEKVNGNDYIVPAIEAGACAVIASEDPSTAALEAARAHGTALLQAPENDVLGALQDVARVWRQQLNSTVVGVTGSSGKTTTKDLIAQVLSVAYTTHATPGNRNSEIGLSETILNATPEHQAVVVEMGMQALGEIDLLCQVARPHIGVITNIGVAHCELLGSRDNIARAKAELLASLPNNTGIAILPGDDPYSPFLRTEAQLDERMIRITTYGLGSQNDIRATNIEYDAMGHPSFDVWIPDGSSYRVRLSLQGEHNILNALAAVTVGLKMNVPIQSIVGALAAVKPAALRQEIATSAQGDVILNDTYNANPDSMRAAISLLMRLATQGKRVAVLGDMYELGSEEVKYHRQIGEYVFVNGVDELVTVGKLGAEIAQGARAVGMPSKRVHECKDVSEALEALNCLRNPGAGKDAALAGDTASASDATHKRADEPWIILVKASRGMQLERLVETLVESQQSKGSL